MGINILLNVLLVSQLIWVARTDDSCPGLPTCFCNKDKTSVNCDGKHFTDIPDTIPPTVEKLYLRYNSITTIRTKAFSSLYRLESLWLNNNQVTKIEPHAFGNLTSLKYLDLRNNKMALIGKNTFSGMNRLETMYLMTNEIKTFENDVFIGTESLKSLYLQSNQLTTVPALGNLPYLEKLILEGNLIKNATFPESFRNCTRLSYLILSDNDIEGIDNITFMALTNNSMSTLYISSNSIATATTGTFSPFSGIKSLKLGSNPIGGTALKMAIESLQGKDMVSLDLSDLHLNGVLLEDTFDLLRDTTLTTLNMRHNKMVSLPNNVFTGLDTLLHLDLSSCQIMDTQEESFNGLDKLTILNLQTNKLVEIPSNLPATLEKLYLDDNQIVTVQEKVFSNLGRLVELRVQYNKIQTLMQDSFLGLTRLNQLSLYSNAIATLPGKVFNPLVRLTQLSLAKNNLVEVQRAIGRFSSQGSLVYLNLADNQCSYLQPDFFRDLISLKYLHLERNRLGTLIQEDYGGALFQGLLKLKELHLMDNGITNVPDATFKSLGAMVLLNVSSNKIAGWGESLLRSAQKLQAIDLSSNLIANLKSSNLKNLAPTMNSLNLSGNPFMCGCDLRWFRDWINKTPIQLTNNASYECNGPKEWKNKPLMSFDRTKINCFRWTWWEIAIIVAVPVLIVIIICSVMYRKRWWIKLFIYKRTRKSRTRNDGRRNYGAIEQDEEIGRRFDGYISCAEDDHRWIRDHLLPGIDNGKTADMDKDYQGEFALYFEPRDFEPGRSLAGNIFENMSGSRKVIVILSRNYLNPMNVFELDLATNLMYERTIDSIIVIHIHEGLPNEKIPKHLMHTMRKNDVLEWTDDQNAQKLVKEKLVEYLSKNVKAVDQDAE